jgi:hypothetical protein
MCSEKIPEAQFTLAIQGTNESEGATKKRRCHHDDSNGELGGTMFYIDSHPRLGVAR